MTTRFPHRPQLRFPSTAAVVTLTMLPASSSSSAPPNHEGNASRRPLSFCAANLQPCSDRWERPRGARCSQAGRDVSAAERREHKVSPVSHMVSNRPRVGAEDLMYGVRYDVGGCRCSCWDAMRHPPRTHGLFTCRRTTRTLRIQTRMPHASLDSRYIYERPNRASIVSLPPSSRARTPDAANAPGGAACSPLAHCNACLLHCASCARRALPLVSVSVDHPARCTTPAPTAYHFLWPLHPTRDHVCGFLDNEEGLHIAAQWSDSPSCFVGAPAGAPYSAPLLAALVPAVD
ncbi:hypothetical protein C8R46DRAFT_580336 [Mycena filopes]|nr:hypothetical protein C8R46DRAFT_580336 [Mycena filopes]